MQFNSLLCDSDIIKVVDEKNNVREIKFHKMSIKKTLDIAEKYNRIIVDLKKKIKGAPSLEPEKQVEYILSQDMAFSKMYFDRIVKLCLCIIRPQRFFQRLKARFSGNWISKKYVFENFDTQTVIDFVQLILKPIISEKKTIT